MKNGKDSQKESILKDAIELVKKEINSKSKQLDQIEQSVRLISRNASRSSLTLKFLTSIIESNDLPSLRVFAFRHLSIAKPDEVKRYVDDFANSKSKNERMTLAQVLYHICPSNVDSLLKQFMDDEPIVWKNLTQTLVQYDREASIALLQNAKSNASVEKSQFIDDVLHRIERYTGTRKCSGGK